MARKRIVKTYRDTSAAGDKTRITGNRYFIRLSLTSIKVERSGDLLSRSSEIYFKCGAGGKLGKLSPQRMPQKGTINIERNEVFKATPAISRYTEFKDQKGGGTIEIPLKVYERDIGADDKLIDTEISVTLGQTNKFLSFSEKGIKIKVSASAKITRF